MNIKFWFDSVSSSSVTVMFESINGEGLVPRKYISNRGIPIEDTYLTILMAAHMYYPGFNFGEPLTDKNIDWKYARFEWHNNVKFLNQPYPTEEEIKVEYVKQYNQWLSELMKK